MSVAGANTEGSRIGLESICSLVQLVALAGLSIIALTSSTNSLAHFPLTVLGTWVIR